MVGKKAEKRSTTRNPIRNRNRNRTTNKPALSKGPPSSDRLLLKDIRFMDFHADGAKWRPHVGYQEFRIKYSTKVSSFRMRHEEQLDSQQFCFLWVIFGETCGRCPAFYGCCAARTMCIRRDCLLSRFLFHQSALLDLLKRLTLFCISYAGRICLHLPIHYFTSIRTHCSIAQPPCSSLKTSSTLLS